jgi:hypothetical protein
VDRSQQIIAVEEDVTIVVKAHGNLDVIGWDRPEVGITTDINVQKVRHEKNLLRLLFVEDCELSVPQTSSLIIERVSENVRLRDIQQMVTINRVQGNLTVRNVQQININRVSEDCLLENIGGEIEIGRIGETLKGKNIQASIKVERVSGQVRLLGLGSGVEIRSGESIEASLVESNQEKVFLKSSENIFLHLPVNPNAALQVKSGGELIEFDTGDLQKKLNDPRCEIRIGNGSQKIVLDAGNRVKVTGEILDEKEILRLFSELDQLWLHLKEESKARQEAREEKVNWEIKMVNGAAKIAQEAMEGVGAVAGQIAEETIQQAESHVREALKRVEEQIRNLGYEVSIEEDDYYREEKDPDVTAEEKLIVMRLLEQQKISVEEADRLLEVLSDVSR